MPFMETGLGIQKSQLGLFLTLHGLLYGVSKFANGFFGDRAHARNVSPMVQIWCSECGTEMPHYEGEN